MFTKLKFSLFLFSFLELIFANKINFANLDTWLWEIQRVDSVGNVGQYTNLFFDAEGKPIIVYYDATNGDLKLANWTGGGWSISILDTFNDVGRYPSIFIDNLNRKHISYYDVTNSALKYAGYLRLPWSWDIQIVDAVGNVGQYTSLAIDNSNYPHISYYDAGLKDLKFVYFDGFNWNKEIVDTTGAVGKYTSLALGGAFNRNLSYYDESNGDLKFAFAIDYDAMVVNIIAPESIVKFDTAIEPKTKIKNDGLKLASFPVYFNIGNYSETLQVTLRPGAETTLTFPAWRANIRGTFLAKCSVQLREDGYPYNNSKIKFVAIDSGFAPIIFSVSPSRGGAGGRVTVEIKGQNFERGLSVKLTKEGQPDIVVDSLNLKFISSSRIIAKFDLQNAELGEWSLVVTNPNNRFAILYNGFTIEPRSSGGLWTYIVGNPTIRAGREDVFFVHYGNNGNVDEENAVLKLDFLGGARLIKILTSDDSILKIAGGQGGRPDTHGLKLFWLPTIPPNKSDYLKVFVRAPNAGSKRKHYESNLELRADSADEDVVIIIPLIISVVGPWIATAMADAFIDVYFDYVTVGRGTFRERISVWLNKTWQKMIGTSRDIPVSACDELFSEFVTDAVEQGIAQRALSHAFTWLGYATWFYERYNYWKQKERESRHQSEVIRPIDPNAKGAPAGVSLFWHWLPKNQRIHYTIWFENVDSATAPAETILIADKLDPCLDINTLSLDSVSHPHCCTTWIDASTRTIYWLFRGINLPPNRNPPEGEGWCRFSIMPYQYLTSRTPIYNYALITFDVNPPMSTDTVFNTIDAGPPSSFVRPLSDTTTGSGILLRWKGNDDFRGSGIRAYNIYVREDTGRFKLWLANTSDTMAVFLGKNNTKYAFYSVAIDSAGWEEAPPDTPDAKTFFKGCAKPRLIEPENKKFINDRTPLFVWSRTLGDSGSYTLQYALDSNFTSQVRSIYNIQDTFFNLPESLVLAETTYFWRVEAIGRGGVRSGFQTPYKIYIDTTKPSAPTLIFPSNNATISESTPTFIWSNSAGLRNLYRLYIFLDTLLDTIAIYPVRGETTFIIPQIFALWDTVYYWRVLAFDSAGNQSVPQQLYRFRVSLPDIYQISGKVKYYSDTTLPVSETKLILSGAANDTITTNNQGEYIFPRLPAQRNYVVTPEKFNRDWEPAISSYDAALILKHAVHLDTLDSLQKISANVSGDTLITSYDAALVLKYIIGSLLHFPVGDWAFRPPFRYYDSLRANQFNQDYKAILYGDPSGNWPGNILLFTETDKKPVNYFFVNFPNENLNNLDYQPINLQKEIKKEINAIKLPELEVENLSPTEIKISQPYHSVNLKEERELVIYPIELKDVRELISADIRISYNSENLKPVTIRTTDITRNFLVAGADYKGFLRIAMAGTEKLTGDIKLLEIVFEQISSQSDKEISETNEINIDWIIINEGELKEIKPAVMGKTKEFQAFSLKIAPTLFANKILISYTIPKETKVNIKIYNSLGQEVRTLVNENKKPGKYSLFWNGKNGKGREQPNGVYFIRMNADGIKLEQKVILLR